MAATALQLVLSTSLFVLSDTRGSYYVLLVTIVVTAHYHCVPIPFTLHCIILVIYMCTCIYIHIRNLSLRIVPASLTIFYLF